MTKTVFAWLQIMARITTILHPRKQECRLTEMSSDQPSTKPALQPTRSVHGYTQIFPLNRQPRTNTDACTLRLDHHTRQMRPSKHWCTYLRRSADYNRNNTWRAQISRNISVIDYNVNNQIVATLLVQLIPAGLELTPVTRHSMMSSGQVTEEAKQTEVKPDTINRKNETVVTRRVETEWKHVKSSTTRTYKVRCNPLRHKGLPLYN